jgi:transcriptional/translational regulatory protein YebC/TACO1
VEAHHPDGNADAEAAAIEAGAQDFVALTNADDAEIPESATGARFFTAPTDLHAVSQWLGQNGWTIVTSELGYAAKNFPELSKEDREQVGEFLQTLEDHDDVHRVWAAVR